MFDVVFRFVREGASGKTGKKRASLHSDMYKDESSPVYAEVKQKRVVQIWLTKTGRTVGLCYHSHRTCTVVVGQVPDLPLLRTK